MKKFFYLAMALSLVACQAEKVDVGGDVNGDKEVNYLSVNLATTLGTRADTYLDDYEDGIVDENVVTKVRFYFFSGDDAIQVAGPYSYQDWTPGESVFPTGTPDETPNVEKVLNATLIIQTESGAKIPDEVIVVLNPNANVDALGNAPTKAQVLAHAKDLTDRTKGFVMTTSTYMDKDDETIVCSNSLEGHLFASAAEALANPVTVYVERVVAKVDLSIGDALAENPSTIKLDNGTYLFNTGKLYGSTPIYVKFLGYNVTSTADQTYLVKQVSADWDNSTSEENLFNTATEPWNWALYHRSFWAINPEGVGFKYGSFSDEEDVETLYPAGGENANPVLANTFNFGNDSEGNPLKNIVYVPENAGESAAAAAQAWPTQVIIGAQLCKNDGTPLPLAEYSGVKMDPEDLPTAYLQSFKNVNAKVYRKMSDKELEDAKDDGTITDQNATEGYKSLDVDDIEIKTAWQSVDGDAAVGGTNQTGRYKVYAQLTKAAAEEIQWYNSNEDGTSANEEAKLDAEEVNKILKNLGAAKVWTEGDTYYFFNIEHLANPNPGLSKPVKPDFPGATDEEGLEEYKQAVAAYERQMEEYEAAVKAMQATPGYYGVVRNHVYRATINTLFGLGTPVFDPDEIIYPEKTEDELVYVAAEIKILAWRIVNQNVDLVW